MPTPTNAKFLLWKDEGDIGPVFFYDTDPNLPRPFVFTPSPPVAVDREWMTKRAAKALARTLGAEFREG